MSSTMYRVISHLDKPKRILSLTMDEFSIALLGVMLLVSSNHKWLVVGIFFALFTGLRHIKKGQGPNILLVKLYWFFPQYMSQVIVTSLPASHLRVWKA